MPKIMSFSLKNRKNRLALRVLPSDPPMPPAAGGYAPRPPSRYKFLIAR